MEANALAADDPPEGRRQRKVRQTREALAEAAVELILERGLAGVTVEAIADRADVARRTFSRHFAGKEVAALEFVRLDGARINDRLRARPAAEPPLLAYRRSVCAWLAGQQQGEQAAWHGREQQRRLFALMEREPALLAAYESVRIEAQDESVRIIAARLGVEPVRDLRPGVAVGAAAGVLVAALRTWAHPGNADTDLLAIVERSYDAIIDLAAGDPGDEVAMIPGGSSAAGSASQQGVVS
ncbi:TetR/AcrR family transcriptional regulator [Streptomyces boninensis]|uniref:TetR/AcrR family transcriptional regulator n=1 Tax=Streptomyces boninensis TaxID=2039455 RepID=UPI003B21D88D